MAKMLIDQLAGDYEPGEYEDDYAIAVKELVRAKVEGGEVRVSAAEPEESGEVVDLLAALARSVEKAKASRGEAPAPAKSSRTASGAKKKAAAKKTTAKKTRPRRPRRRRPGAEGELTARMPPHEVHAIGAAHAGR